MLEGIGIGVLHISYLDFYELFDLRIITNAIRAHYKHESEKNIEQWRMVRHIAVLYYNGNVKKQDQIRNPSDYMWLPGDKKKFTKPVALSFKQIEKLIS